MKSIHVLRKPCSEPTVAANVLRHGTGGINVNGSRVRLAGGETVTAGLATPANRAGEVGRNLGFTKNGVEAFQRAQRESIERTNTLGRWPANLVLGACLDSELDEVFPHNKGKVGMTQHSSRNNVYGGFRAGVLSRVNDGADDEGSAARYFKRVN